MIAITSPQLKFLKLDFCKFIFIYLIWKPHSTRRSSSSRLNNSLPPTSLSCKSDLHNPHLWLLRTLRRQCCQLQSEWITINLLKWQNYHRFVSRQFLKKDVYRRTIEIPQCTSMFKANHCLKVHNVHFKVASSILGQKDMKTFVFVTCWRSNFHERY